MRILVTNDDGIESEGLHVLARRLTDVGAVTVFCPSTNFSGAGAAIGHIGAGLPDVVALDRQDLAGVEAVYHFDGPPALATLLACKGLFGPVPEIVVSGINPGWNVGHSVHFSGTIGAVVTAGVFGLSAIAVSQPVAGPGERQLWETAAEVVVSLVDDLVTAPVPRDSPRLLNVNVPNLAAGELRGREYTTLAPRLPYGLDAPTLAHKGDGIYAADFVRFAAFESPPGSDTYAVERGYVSITPLASTHATA
jgi:5'-nucleotidase